MVRRKLVNSACSKHIEHTNSRNEILTARRSMGVTRFLTIFLALSSVGANGLAQDLQAPGAVEVFCKHAAPSLDAETTTQRLETIRREVLATLQAKALDQVSVTDDHIEIRVPAEIALPSPVVLDLVKPHILDFQLGDFSAQEWRTKLELGLVDVQLVMMARAITDNDIEYCVHDETRRRVRVELVGVRLIGNDGARLAEAQTLLGREISIRRGLGWPTYLAESVPHVEVRADKVTQGASNVQPEVWQQLRARALGCYVGALKSNARLQGAVVLTWRPSVANSTVLVDTLRDTELTGCLSKAAGDVAAGAQDDQSVWRAKIFLKLTPSSRL